MSTINTENPESTPPFDPNENPERIYTIDDEHRLVIRKMNSGEFIIIPQCRIWFEEPQLEYAIFGRIEDADDHAAVVMAPSRRKAYASNS